MCIRDSLHTVQLAAPGATEPWGFSEVEKTSWRSPFARRVQMRRSWVHHSVEGGGNRREWLGEYWKVHPFCRSRPRGGRSRRRSSQAANQEEIGGAQGSLRSGI